MDQKRETSIEINLGFIGKELFKYKYFIISVSIVFSLAGVFYSLSLPNSYKSKALLSVPKESSNPSFGSLAANITGLPGVSSLLNSSVNANAEEAYEIFRSTNFLTTFIEKYSLDKYIIAGESVESGKVIFNENYNPETNSWKSGSKPSSQTVLREFLDNHLSFDEDLERGFLTISIEYISPELSKFWVEQMVIDINNTLKNRDVRETEASIQFLESKLKEIKDINAANVFSSLLQEEYKKLMLANSSEEYFFKTIDPPFISEYKSSPSRAIICFFFLFSGLSLSSIIIILRKTMS